MKSNISLKKSILILLVLISAATNDVCSMQKVSLVKKGGALPKGNTSFQGGTLVNNNTLVFSNGLSNWTTVFERICSIINTDPQNYLSSIQYEILIEADNKPYLVGEQKRAKLVYFNGKNIIRLKGKTDRPVSNVTIKGVNGIAHIKYVDSLYYGTWLPPKSKMKICDKLFYNNSNHPAPFPGTEKCNNNRKTNCTMGFFIRFDKCKNINVENINVDGNMNSVRLGGGASKKNVGRQLNYTGALVQTCEKIKFKSCSFNNFGLDGITIRGFSESISLYNVQCSGSGRQGLTWAGGNNIKVENSIFENSGQGRFKSAPVAGLDIEPGPIKFKDKTGKEIYCTCTNGQFISCTFRNNRGWDCIQDSGPERTENILFDNCTFERTKGKYSVWIRGRNVVFKNSTIMGGFIHGNSENKQFATKFYNTTFIDPPLNSSGKTKYYLLNTINSNFMTFDSCTFALQGRKNNFISLQSKTLDQNKFANFTNCKFIQSKEAISGTKPNLLKGVKFKGHNQFINESSKPNMINIERANFEGNHQQTNPNKTEVSGKIRLGLNGKGAQNQVKIGRNNAKHILIINDKATFAVGGRAQTSVSNNSEIITKKGGELIWKSENSDVKGNIILEDYSKANLTNKVRKKAPKYKNSKIIKRTSPPKALPRR